MSFRPDIVAVWIYRVPDPDRPDAIEILLVRRAPGRELAGLWEAKLRFGPDIRGPLIIEHAAGEWRATATAPPMSACSRSRMPYRPVSDPVTIVRSILSTSMVPTRRCSK